MKVNTRRWVSFVALVAIWVVGVADYGISELISNLVIILSTMILAWQVGYLSDFNKRNHNTDYRHYEELIWTMKDETQELEMMIQNRNKEIGQHVSTIYKMEALIKTLDFTLDNCIKAEKGEDSNTIVYESKLKAYEYFKMFTEMYIGKEDRF